MPTKSRVVKALSAVLPGGALGASIVLAFTSPTAAEAKSYSAAVDPSPSLSVSERLREIRAGVSEISNASGRLVPTWWGNWGNGGWGRWPGWRNGGWPNWHNWGNGWHNWGNGPWNNGGWNNGGWHNFWHNW